MRSTDRDYSWVVFACGNASVAKMMTNRLSSRVRVLRATTPLVQGTRVPIARSNHGPASTQVSWSFAAAPAEPCALRADPHYLAGNFCSLARHCRGDGDGPCHL